MTAPVARLGGPATLAGHDRVGGVDAVWRGDVIAVL